MTIGVEGQYIFSASIDRYNDFIEEDDLIEFTIIEEVGNVLPTFSMAFVSSNEDILRLLNEGNIIKIQFGKDRNDIEDIKLSTNKLKTAKEGGDKRIYEISGFATDINYLTDHFQTILSKKSAVEATLEVASKSFKIKSNIRKSSDSQVWIQYNISDKRFVNEIYTHADIDDSFLAIAILADGTFVLKDVLKDIDRNFSNLYDWKLTQDVIDESKDIRYDPDYLIDSNAGLINNWIGYGKNTFVNNMVTGVQDEVLEQPKTVLSLSKDVDKNSEIDKRYAGEVVINENVHENFHSSYNHNVLSLANLSKIENTVSFSDRVYKVKPLDLIMFSDRATDRDNQANEQVSGLYIISKVARTIMSKRVVTTLALNREAFNKVKNGGLV